MDKLPKDDDDDDNLYRRELEEMDIDNISVESWRTPSEASFHSDDHSIIDQYLADSKEDMNAPELDSNFFLDNSKIDGNALEMDSHIFVKDSN